MIHLKVVDFAAAVERLCDPGPRGRPLIVAPLGTARALVHDMSQEAFASGARKHMPLERALLLRRTAPLSPLVEADEAGGHLFLDLTGTGRLWGLSTNKLMAMVATRLVKPGGEEACLRPLPLHLLPGLARADLLLLREQHHQQVGQVLARDRPAWQEPPQVLDRVGWCFAPCLPVKKY